MAVFERHEKGHRGAEEVRGSAPSDFSRKALNSTKAETTQLRPKPHANITPVRPTDNSPFSQITMAAQQNLPQIPNVKFRVLIIGRANAGKTTILQRVCNTTESPQIYRTSPSGRRQRVRLLTEGHFLSHHPARFNLTLRQRLGPLEMLILGAG